MKIFKKISDNSKCWWCGSQDLSQEHKYKKTDLELLYGKSYLGDKRITRTRFRTESKGKYLQSSNSKLVKFQSNLCKMCNNEKSQDFDFAYEKLVNHYYHHKFEILKAGGIDLERVYENRWKQEIENVEKYIVKHVGCRIAELGFKPHSNLIKFLNGDDLNKDMKILFQNKTYQFGESNNPIECIFLGPIIPINASCNKSIDIVTSFTGWYTFVNLSWNYLFEENVNSKSSYTQFLPLDLFEYKESEILNIELHEETLEKDWGLGLERIEYYPFKGESKDLDHYNYMKDH